MKKVLFVTYGSGHVRMVVPVAKALEASGVAQVQVLALTTAASVARAAGLDVLQFKDFLTPEDGAALAHGQRLLAGMAGPIADPDETVAYLGLCYAELEQDVGPNEAERRYMRDGRQAFLPQRVAQRIVARTRPSLLVATNSPRAERAAIMAARAFGVPSICLVDLFCLDEVLWVGTPGYADRVCVLNGIVRDFLIAAGRSAQDLCVTGNPAFDALSDPITLAEGRQLRTASGWDGYKVLLWPTQVEPAFHPFNGLPGDTQLPTRALAEVAGWVMARDKVVLCVRPRAGEKPPELSDHPNIVVLGQQTPLAPLLHAVDLVVTLNSTVGLEGHLAGTRLVQVLGSVFDSAMPLKRFGIADEEARLGAIGPALERALRLTRATSRRATGGATARVLDVILSYL